MARHHQRGVGLVARHRPAAASTNASSLVVFANRGVKSGREDGGGWAGHASMVAASGVVVGRAQSQGKQMVVARLSKATTVNLARGPGAAARPPGRERPGVRPPEISGSNGGLT